MERTRGLERRQLASFHPGGTNPPGNARGFAGPSDRLGRFTAFVIDPDDGSRAALVWLLESFGVPVDAFATAAEFFEVCVDRAGIVLADLAVPCSRGIEFLAGLRARGGKQAVIFLDASPDGSEATAEELRAAGASGYLLKPFPAEELLHQIDEMLNLGIAARPGATRTSRPRRFPSHLFGDRLETSLPPQGTG